MAAHDASAAAPAEPPLSTQALNTLAILRDLVGNTAGLAALEARLAALSLAGIVATALAAGFAVMAFWLLLQAALIVGFMRLGADLLWLLAGFTLLNAASVVLCLYLIRRLGGNLTFRATAAALRGRAMDATAETPGPP
jgi:hypothetical protein